MQNNTGEDIALFPRIVGELLRRKRLSAIGTRAVWRDGPDDYRVRCATCDGGGSVRHKSRADASRAACRDSGQPCRACGAS